MWKYKSITRQEFDSIKDAVEKFIMMLGGKQVSADLPDAQKTHPNAENRFAEAISVQPVFEYRGKYYRVDEICFPEKPHIVIECGTLEALISNTMEDADPFPYDLPGDELLKEVRYSLGIEPYPL